nr:hypothetical protein [Desulfatitalea tepidiphila]
MVFDLLDFFGDFSFTQTGAKALIIDMFDIGMLKMGFGDRVAVRRISIDLSAKIERGNAVGFDDPGPFLGLQGDAVGPSKSGGNKPRTVIALALGAIGHGSNTLRHQIEAQGRLVPLIRGKRGADEIFMNVAHNHTSVDQGSALVVEVKFDPDRVADVKIPFDIQLEFDTGARDIDHAHVAFVHIAVLEAAEVDAGQVGGFPVLTPLFKGDFETVTTVAGAIDGDFFVDGCKLGDIGGGHIAALGTDKGGGVVAGNEDLFNHAEKPDHVLGV